MAGRRGARQSLSLPCAILRASPQQFFLEPTGQLEVPTTEAKGFNIKPLYGDNKTVPTSISDGMVIKLAPLELITLELTPIK